MDESSNQKRFFAVPRFPDPLPDWPASDPKVPKASEFLEKWSTVTECAICLQKMEEETKVYVKDCRHPFCYTCISQWLKSFENREMTAVPCCPTCKHPSTEIYKVYNGKVDVIQVIRRSAPVQWPDPSTPQPINPNVLFFDPEDVYFVRELWDSEMYDPFYDDEWESIDQQPTTGSESPSL